jgi:UDP-glucuronate 4-epimerase
MTKMRYTQLTNRRYIISIKILITGAAGFIGSNLSKNLLNRDNSVIGLDNLNDYYDPAWKLQNIKNLDSYDNFTFIKGDVLEEDLLESIFSNNEIDAVVHLAARAGVRPSIEEPKLYESVNVRGTLNMLEAVREYSVNKFVFASSSSVYGNQSKVPFSENDKVDLPISPYAATKKAGEELCYTYSHLYSIGVTCLRFFTVYGPNGRPDMAPYMFTESIMKGKEIKRFGNGDSARDYTYVDDIVQGITAAISYKKSFDVFNLGNSSPINLNDFISTIEKITGNKAIIKELPMQPGDVSITYADISKAKRLLGYSPTTRLEDGLALFYEWLIKSRLHD